MALPKMKPLRDPAEVELPALAEHPRYKAMAAELAALEQRYAEAEGRLKVAQARQRGQRPTQSNEARAKALLAGGTVTAASPEAEIVAAQEELTVLQAAIFKQREAIAALVGELSFEVCQRLVPLNCDYLRQALVAATALHEALEAARVLRARIIMAGYDVNTIALPTHHFPAGAALGDPTRVGQTPAALFQTWLKEKGII